MLDRWTYRDALRTASLRTLHALDANGNAVGEFNREVPRLAATSTKKERP